MCRNRFNRLWAVCCLTVFVTVALLTGCKNSRDTGSREAKEAVSRTEEISQMDAGSAPGQEMGTGEQTDGLILIPGGSFEMGSPESEAWRSGDETQHSVTVDDFYLSPLEVTQEEYNE